MVGVAAVVAIAPAPASAAVGAPRGPEATVKAYISAFEHRRPATVCALLDPSVKRGSCRKSIAEERRGTPIARARVGGTFARGGHARVLVDLVYAGTRYVDPLAVRDRVLLRRRGGGWRIAATTTLPGARFAIREPVDPVPSDRAAALRRLADDELLAISGNGSLLCGLLAPGAPLSGRLGGCRQLAGSIPEVRESARIARYRAHVTGPTSARLDVTVVASRAARQTAAPGYRLRTRRWTATVFAVRVGGRWRLAKPSRSLYRGIAVVEPGDVDAPGATATWPQAALPRPSFSERATPAACATPPAVWGLRCRGFGGAAFAARPGGGSLVAWTEGEDFTSYVRPAAAGSPTAPASRYPDLSPISDDQDALWVVDGLAPVADGALILESDQATGASAAIPVDADGRPRGAPVRLSRGSGDPEDVVAPVVVPSPPGGPALVLVDDVEVRRLGADGRPAGPTVRLHDPLSGDVLLGRADGGLTVVRGDYAKGVSVAGLGADGRASGVQVLQPPSGPRMRVDAATPAVAVDATGRALVAWVEEDQRGTATIRAWVLDPANAAVTAPVAVSTFPVGVRGDATFDPFDRGRAAVSAGASPGGGWSVAWAHAHGTGAGDGLSVVRLNPDGTPTAPPIRVAGLPGDTDYGDALPFGIAGDAVAWVEPPPRVGLPQIQARALP